MRSLQLKEIMPTKRRTRCGECNCVLEPDEKTFCHSCRSDLDMSGGVEMFDYSVEHSYGG